MQFYQEFNKQAGLGGAGDYFQRREEELAMDAMAGYRDSTNEQYPGSWTKDPNSNYWSLDMTKVPFGYPEAFWSKMDSINKKHNGNLYNAYQQKENDPTGQGVSTGSMGYKMLVPQEPPMLTVTSYKDQMNKDWDEHLERVRNSKAGDNIQSTSDYMTGRWGKDWMTNPQPQFQQVAPKPEPLPSSTSTVKQSAPMQTTDFKQPTQDSMVKTQSYSDFTKQAFGPGVPFWQPPSMESQMTNWDKGYKSSPQFGQYSDRMAQDLSGSWDTMFQSDMDSIFNDPKLNGFDLSDADLQRYDLAGYQNYKDRWPEYRKQLIERNNSLRSQHEFNLRNWGQLIQSFTKQKGRAPNAQEKAQLATLFDRKFGQNKAKQAVDYASMRVTRNKMRDTTSAGDLQKGKYYVTGGSNKPYLQPGQGTTTTTQTEQETDPQQDPRWYDTVYQLMQEHPGMSSGVAALIAASLIYGSGSGKKRDRGTDLLLALLGGGAAYWGMNKWLSPAQATAVTTPAEPQADASQST